MRVVNMDMAKIKTHSGKHSEMKEKWESLEENQCLLFDNKKEATNAYLVLQAHCNKPSVYAKGFKPAFRTLDDGHFGIWRKKL